MKKEKGHKSAKTEKVRERGFGKKQESILWKMENGWGSGY